MPAPRPQRMNTAQRLKGKQSFSKPRMSPGMELPDRSSPARKMGPTGAPGGADSGVKPKYKATRPMAGKGASRFSAPARAKAPASKAMARRAALGRLAGK